MFPLMAHAQESEGGLHVAHVAFAQETQPLKIRRKKVPDLSGKALDVTLLGDL